MPAGLQNTALLHNANCGRVKWWKMWVGWPMYLNGFPSLVNWLRHCSTTLEVHWFTLLCWYAFPPIVPSIDCKTKTEMFHKFRGWKSRHRYPRFDVKTVLPTEQSCPVFCLSHPHFPLVPTLHFETHWSVLLEFAKCSWSISADKWTLQSESARIAINLVQSGQKTNSPINSEPLQICCSIEGGGGLSDWEILQGSQVFLSLPWYAIPTKRRGGGGNRTAYFAKVPIPFVPTSQDVPFHYPTPSKWYGKIGEVQNRMENSEKCHSVNPMATFTDINATNAPNANRQFLCPYVRQLRHLP